MFMRGVVKALALQKSVIWINLFGCWILNSMMAWLFAYHLNYGVVGLWIARIILEIFIYISFSSLVYLKDWNVIIQESLQRQKKDMDHIIDI
jgi:Na+-driven multidrug efflux pump